jgi:hypothetical protein
MDQRHFVRRLYVQFVCCLLIVNAYRSSDYFSFYTHNRTKPIVDDNNNNNDFLERDRQHKFDHGLTYNHSVHRRQTPLNIVTSEQARLRSTPSYIVVGPRVIRPAQIVSLSVTILRREWHSMLVKASISNDHVAIAVVEQTLMFSVPQTLEMNMPTNIRHGTYRLTIEGRLTSGERKFYNISELIFEQKAVAIFIQLDRPIFRHETVVQFRCIPIYPDLSGYFHTVDVYILSPSGHILRKWENQQTTAGIVSLEARRPMPNRSIPNESVLSLSLSL